jgi:hypothetical protein
MPSISRFDPDTLRRMARLRDNVLDLSIALDDLDAERARLDSLLREAQAELAEMIGRAA